MPELHLADPIVKKYSACGPFKKHTKRIQDFLNTGKLSYIHENDLDKACFQHDMTYNKFKNLEKRTQSDIVFLKKSLKIVVYNFFDKKSRGIPFTESGLKENK